MGIAESTPLQRPLTQLRQRLDHALEDLQGRGWELLRRTGLDLWHYDLGLDDADDRLVEDDLG